MLGAIVGDIAGSVYEGNPIKTTDFPLFHRYGCLTDDTILTVAVADALMDEAGAAAYLRRADHYIDKLHDWFCRYPDAGYGDAFYWWADARDRQPYGSWGNGSAMRVSPVAYARASLPEVLVEARTSAAVTHDHEEGIKGAQAVAAAVFLALQGSGKAEIKRMIEERFGYDLGQPIAAIRETYAFDVSCQGSVPQSITAFLESASFEEAVRLAISLGGDADTMACIAGSIAEPFYGGAPREIAEQAMGMLDDDLREVVRRFYGWAESANPG